jgi:hypothetical protein
MLCHEPWLVCSAVRLGYNRAIVTGAAADRIGLLRGVLKAVQALNFCVDGIRGEGLENFWTGSLLLTARGEPLSIKKNFEALSQAAKRLTEVPSQGLVLTGTAAKIKVAEIKVTGARGDTGFLVALTGLLADRLVNLSTVRVDTRIEHVGKPSAVLSSDLFLEALLPAGIPGKELEEAISKLDGPARVTVRCW